MTLKEFLSLPYDLNKRMEVRRMRIEELRAAAERTTSALDAMPRGEKDPHARESIIASLSDLVTAQEYDLMDLLDAEKAVKDALDLLPLEKANIYEIASLRYLSFKTWREISDIVGLAQAQVFRLAKQAIDLIEVPEKYNKTKTS